MSIIHILDIYKKIFKHQYIRKSDKKSWFLFNKVLLKPMIKGKTPDNKIVKKEVDNIYLYILISPTEINKKFQNEILYLKENEINKEYDYIMN